MTITDFLAAEHYFTKADWCDWQGCECALWNGYEKSSKFATGTRILEM